MESKQKQQPQQTQPPPQQQQQQQQSVGGEDLPSPSIQAFKDWASKPAKEAPPVGRLNRQAPEDLAIAANISEGETVVTIGACPDLGPQLLSGAVGQTGQVICVIPKKSTSEAAQAAMRCNMPNVRCLESPMTTIEARDNTADVVMSSVLSNHVAQRDIPSVLDESFRVLKPGGRALIADVLLRNDMPEVVRSTIPKNCNMLSTNVTAETYQSYMRSAGFENVLVRDSKKDINNCLMDQHGAPVSPTQQQEPSGAYEGQQTSRKEEDKSSSYRRKVGKFTRGLVSGQEEKEEDVDWNDYVGMFHITARKPQ